MAALADNNAAVTQITTVLSQLHYPITAKYIADLSGLDKKLVNKTLSANTNALKFEQLPCSPPLWRLRATPAPAPLDSNGSD